MTAPSAAHAVRAIDAAMSAAGQLRDRVTAFVASTWDGMSAWRTADIDAFVDAVLPVVLAGQRQMAAITDANLAQLATLLFGRGAPVGLPGELVSGAALRGVAPQEVYRRPGVTVWTELAAGKPLDAAVAAGRRRALNLAGTDLQLARTHTARLVLAGDGRVTGFRRTLSGSENCGICVVASTQRYHKRDLMPIHPGCDCGVSPIYGDRDPGQVIDAGLLEEAHAAVAERLGESDRSAAGYRELILVRQHGEIGPMLTVKGQRFSRAGGNLSAPVRAAPLDLTGLTDDALAQRVAEVADDEAALEAVLAELDRRDQAAAAQQAAQRAVNDPDAKKWAEVDRRAAAGEDYEAAYADVFGISLGQLRREEAIRQLREAGHKGRGFDELARDAFRVQLDRDYLTAEAATNGFLLSPEGQRRGLDPRELWRQNETYARRWASDELKAWWDANGRITFDVYRDQLLSGRGEQRFRSGGESFLS